MITTTYNFNPITKPIRTMQLSYILYYQYSTQTITTSNLIFSDIIFNDEKIAASSISPFFKLSLNTHIHYFEYSSTHLQ